ncbi:hypothetical protein J2T22_002678 [Pseudarthrobacter defluvii]|uniref:PucR-like helix-turn-helix protein n=1 Tax=Pseudarthrobacter defluvii TaxID=410837 RepID=A0ABT9UKJ2_9MICC|nr:hypothetical protein [Pseudarthrobacter defluvii]
MLVTLRRYTTTISMLSNIFASRLTIQRQLNRIAGRPRDFETAALPLAIQMGSVLSI